MTLSQTYAELLRGPKFWGQVDEDAGRHLIALGLAQTYMTSKGEWRVSKLEPQIHNEPGGKMGGVRSQVPYGLGSHKSAPMVAKYRSSDSAMFRRHL